MALAPDQPPEPPLRDDGRAVFGMVGRLAGLVALAAVAAYGFVWFSAPRNGLEDQGFALAAAQNALFGQRSAAPAVSRAGLGPASLNSGSFKPAVFQPPAVPAARADVPPDEAPAVDRPQLLAPVPWPAHDAGRDLADNRRETPTTGAAALAAVPAPHAAAPPLPPTQAEADNRDRSAAGSGAEDRKRGPRDSSRTRPHLSSPMAMSPPHASPFAAPPRAAMRRRRSRWVARSIRWSSGASAPSGSRPIRTRRAAGIKRRRNSDRGMRRSGSISSPNRRRNA